MKSKQTVYNAGQGLSKKERRELRKKQKQLGRIKEARKSRLVKWGFFVGTVFLLVGGGVFFRHARAGRYENAPRIWVAPVTYNFGEIWASQGEVKVVFEVGNEGVSPLVIRGMETSCGCTTAKLKMEDEEAGEVESPRFGMHNNPVDWSVTLEPGAKAKLVVMFDPNFHENASGPVTRTVSVFSNDPGNPKEKVTIYANVKR